MHDIDFGLAIIKEMLQMEAPEPTPDGGTVVEAGMTAIRECLYGAPEPTDPGTIEEACEAIAEFMTSSQDPFIESAMGTINSILGEGGMVSKNDLKVCLMEAVQVYSEGLIPFKIDSIESLKKAIAIVDATPRSSGWLIGIVTVCCTLYAVCMIGLAAGAASLVTLKAGVTSIAAGIGIGLLVGAVFGGLIYFGIELLEWVITKVYNKITGSNEMRPSEISKAVNQILKEMDALEQKLKKAGKVKEVQRVQRIYDDIARRWGIYQQQMMDAAAGGAMAGGFIGANI